MGGTTGTTGAVATIVTVPAGWSAAASSASPLPNSQSMSVLPLPAIGPSSAAEATAKVFETALAEHGTVWHLVHSALAIW